MALPRTKLVYQEQGDLQEYDSKVLSLQPISTLPAADQSLLKDAEPEDYALVVEETIFYVQGGGQLSDTGVIESLPTEEAEAEASTEPGTVNGDRAKTTFEVRSVRHPATGGAILHFGRFRPQGQPGGDEQQIFQIGQPIHQTIDAEKRLLYSRLHTAEHILGLAINALSAAGVLPPLTESKASHYPTSAAVEFGGLIENKHLAAIQAKTDEFVKGDGKVLIHWWPMERLLKECTGVVEGFQLPEGEELGRVVEMVGLGAYPCGGTHVHSCGEVGGIEVRKVARSKGVSRVSYRVL